MLVVCWLRSIIRDLLFFYLWIRIQDVQHAFFQSVNAQICVIPANLWLIRFVSWDFFSRLVSIKYFYLDSQINWLPSIRMTCCITESTPHASLTKWKIINSLHGQVSIQCWSAPFSAITYAQVIVFLAKIEHECYLFCRAYHASLFSVLIQLMLQINYAITIFSYILEILMGAKIIFNSLWNIIY